MTLHGMLDVAIGVFVYGWLFAVFVSYAEFPLRLMAVALSWLWTV